MAIAHTPIGARVPRLIKAGYGISEIGVTGMVVFASFFVFSYMTNTLGIPPAIAGALFLATKLFDVVTDPLVGMLSDRTKSAMGPRRPWLLAGAFVMGPALAIAFLAPFGVPPTGGGAAAALPWLGNAVWFSAFLMLAYLGLTLIGVPYGAMTAEMSEDYEERTRITSWRMFIGSIGIILGASGYAMLTGNFGGQTIAGYRTGMVIILPLLVVPTLLSVVMTRNAPYHAQRVVRRSLLDGARIALSSRPFLALAGSYIIMVGMITVITANVDAMIVYILDERENLASVKLQLSLMLLFPTMLTIPLWAFAARYMDKRTGLVIGGTIYALFTALIWFVGPGDVGLLTAILAIMGVAYAAYQIFPWSMLPDVVSDAQARHGGALAGLFNGYWTTAQKLGIALGPFLAGLVLQAGGFQASTGGDFAAQSETAVMTLKLVVSLLPAAVFMLGLLLILFYPLGRSSTR